MYLASCLEHSRDGLIELADQLEHWVIRQMLQRKVTLQHKHMYASRNTYIYVHLTYVVKKFSILLLHAYAH